MPAATASCTVATHSSVVVFPHSMPRPPPPSVRIETGGSGPKECCFMSRPSNADEQRPLRRHPPAGFTGNFGRRRCFFFGSSRACVGCPSSTWTSGLSPLALHLGQGFGDPLTGRIQPRPAQRSQPTLRADNAVPPANFHLYLRLGGDAR